MIFSFFYVEAELLGSSRSLIALLLRCLAMGKRRGSPAAVRARSHRARAAVPFRSRHFRGFRAWNQRCRLASKSATFAAVVTVSGEAVPLWCPLRMNDFL